MALKLLAELSGSPKVFAVERFEDFRGSFRMVFQHSAFSTFFPNIPSMMQTNLIVGNNGSIRGFHGALESKNHWKIVACTHGQVLHAFMDIRPQSVSFGDTAILESSDRNIEAIVIPPGFAYGIQFTSQDSTLIYATNIEFKDQNEISISPISDTLIHLWPEEVILSERDLHAPSLSKLIEVGFFNAE